MILSSIPHSAASFLTHIADAAIRSLVLGCIAGLALNVTRVKSVSVRLNVWRAVLCVALIMPFLGVFLPAITFRLPAEAGRRDPRSPHEIPASVTLRILSPTPFRRAAGYMMDR